MATTDSTNNDGKNDSEVTVPDASVSEPTANAEFTNIISLTIVPFFEAACHLSVPKTAKLAKLLEASFEAQRQIVLQGGDAPADYDRLSSQAKGLRVIEKYRESVRRGKAWDSQPRLSEAAGWLQIEIQDTQDGCDAAYFTDPVGGSEWTAIERLLYNATLAPLE